MKIVVTTYSEYSEKSHRSFCIKPENIEELDEATDDVASFISECFDQLQEEGF